MKEAKLTYLLKQLNTPQREKLLLQLDMSESTYYRKRDKPGDFRYDEVLIVKQFLDKLHKEDYNMAKLLEPVKVAA